MKFEINLNNLLFYAYHGIYETERHNGNKFTVNLTVSIPSQEGIKEDEFYDDIKHTVSYADLYDIVRQEMYLPCKLLETVALKIAKRIKEEFPLITEGRITIEKDRPPIEGMLGNASVTLLF